MFKQKKPRRFNYKPQYHKDGKLEPEDDLQSRWEAIRDEVRHKTNRNVAKPLPLRTLLIMLVALFVVLYILEGYIK